MKITESELVLNTNTPSREIVIIYDSTLDATTHPFIRALNYSKQGYSLDESWDVPAIGDIVYYSKTRSRVPVKRVSIEDDSVEKKPKQVKQEKVKVENSYTRLLSRTLDEIEL